MDKFNIEFKTTKRDESGSETTQFKKVVDRAALATLISTLATQDGIEYVIVRRVVEPKPKPEPKKVEVKK